MMSNKKDKFNITFEFINLPESSKYLDQVFDLLFSKMEIENNQNCILQSNKKYHIVNVWKNISQQDK